MKHKIGNLKRRNKQKDKKFLTAVAQRKADRKELRKLKKLSRHNFSSKDVRFENTENKRLEIKKRLNNKRRVSNVLFHNDKQPELTTENQTNFNAALKTPREKKEDGLNKYLEKTKIVRKQILVQENEIEEANIRKLEKQLGMKKRKKDSLPSWAKHDGLDYILNTCEEEKLEDTIFDTEDGNESEKDILPDGDSFGEQSSNSDTESDCEPTDQEYEKDEDAETVPLKECKSSNNGDLVEDIYGRLKDKQGNFVQTQSYVPPSLRMPSNINGGVNAKLMKQVKGLFNKLAETNLVPICNEIESLYRNNSRNIMNETLLSVICEAVIQASLTPDSIIRENAMAVAILHGNIGIEIGSYVIEALSKRFAEYTENQLHSEDKVLDNLTILLVFLFCFKVINAVYIFDMLNVFIDKVSDKSISLILLILQHAGFLLRKEDPIKLKEFISKVQQMASEKLNNIDDLRVKFMLESLMSIKNNNMHKIPQYDPSKLDHPRKLVRSIIRTNNPGTELKVTLDDFLKAESKGRWWIVGSAWEGTMLDKIEKRPAKVQEDILDCKLSELARKQMMNTPVRRKIFAVLMSAEDFEDAFEKLLHLNFKLHSEREIIHVIVACCLQEKMFNPYYCCVMIKFLRFHRKFLMTLQCNLWDKFKDLKSLSSHQIMKLANFVSYLIVDGSLPVTVLKVIEFSEMDKTCAQFLSCLLKNLLCDADEDMLSKVFSKVLSPKSKRFKESIRLFLHHLLKQNIINEEKESLISSRIDFVDSILAKDCYNKVQ